MRVNLSTTHFFVRKKRRRRRMKNLCCALAEFALEKGENVLLLVKNNILVIFVIRLTISEINVSKISYGITGSNILTFIIHLFMDFRVNLCFLRVNREYR